MSVVRVENRFYDSFPFPLGAVVFLAQIALGLVLFAAFQEYVPGELGAGAGWGGYLLAIYGGARFISETPTGMLSDRLRRKSSMLLGFLLLVPAVIAMSLTESVAVFGASAAVLGLGTAFLWPAMYAISADLYEPQRRGKVVGFLNVFQLLGFGAGALAGALLVEDAHNAMFIVAVASMSAAGLLAVAAVPGYENPGHERRRAVALRDVWSPQLFALSTLVLLSTAGVAMVIPAIRPFGEEVLDVSFSTVTIALIPGVVLGGALYVPAGHFADRFGRIAPFLAGEALLIAGCLLVAATENLYVAATGGAIIFMGNVMMVPAFNAAVMDLAPETHRGTLIGLVVALSGLGLAVGPAAGGAIASAVSPPAAFQTAALVAAITAAGIVVYRRRYGRAAGATPALAPEAAD